MTTITVVILSLSMIFISHHLQQNLWEIHEPWFSEHANVYLIKGTEKTLLIDTGVGLEHLPSWLEAQGLTPDIVVITHTHFDHCGGLSQFTAEHIFLTSQQAKNIQKIERWGLSYFKEDQLTKTCGHAPYTYKKKPNLPAKWYPLENTIFLGGRTISVIDLPGHTDDSVGFFEEKTGWLFTGDTLYQGKLYRDFQNSNPTHWRESLHKIVSLKPTTIFPGHNDSFDNTLLPTIVKTSLQQLE